MRAVAALALSGLGLAACGTPAAIKPAQNPLPGFSRDISAAQNAVTQREREAQAFGSTGVTAP
jgi:predicted small secreted protein